MVNLISGPIVAAMGATEGVIVKARELIETVLGRGGVGDLEEDDVVEGKQQVGAEPAPDQRNGQLPAGV
ncbi:MAG: hypothetical protein JO044_15570 [Mycobacteriaceae bacterium]|nr:hypothetical protein [Mycobacteriaceae bacterium]